MADIYSNLPTGIDDRFAKSIKELTENQYVEPFSFNVGEYDSAIAFFVKRGFDRGPAEQLAYIMLRQAKIDDVNTQEVLGKLGTASPIQLSEIVQMILNASRYKSSRLGSRETKKSKDIISRNIVK
tara:strand:- start:560 stop:937 length:378 start_codon:yes stop_codon:yes gene_type:complete